MGYDESGYYTPEPRRPAVCGRGRVYYYEVFGVADGMPAEGEEPELTGFFVQLYQPNPLDVGMVKIEDIGYTDLKHSLREAERYAHRLLNERDGLGECMRQDAAL